MTIKFVRQAGPAGKMADAELHFSGGPLDGLRLVGFSVWERKNGSRNVTFPARQYSVGGERRSFALLRPISDVMAQDQLKDLILAAFEDYLVAEGDEAQAAILPTVTVVPPLYPTRGMPAWAAAAAAPVVEVPVVAGWRAISLDDEVTKC